MIALIGRSAISSESGSAIVSFEEVLDQALAMLQRRGRVTYRALQLQFELDDNWLEVLKDDLLFAHSEISDEEGQGLVWAGEPSEPLPNVHHETDRQNRLQTMCLVVMQLLQRERRITYRALKHGSVQGSYGAIISASAT